MMRVSIAALAATLAVPAAAQTSDVAALRREMQVMREHYEQTLKAYEQRLTELEQRLQKAETRPAAPTAAAPAAAPSASAFNPALGVILDGKFGYFSKSPETARLPGFAVTDEARTAGERGFALGETELNLSANIDQALYGSLTVALEREGEIEVEEAFLQTTSLPLGFTVKAGRFFSGIGYLNEQHAHAWDFADQALPYRAFLDTQLGDDGIQLRWLAPLDLFVELGAEAFRGGAFPGGGEGRKWVGNYSLFAHVGDDLGAGGRWGNWRAGVSHLRSQPRERESFDGSLFSGRSNLTIFDAVYKLPLENGRSFKLQGEYFIRDENGLFADLDYLGRQTGLYAQGVWRFLPRWEAALRYDQLDSSNEGTAVPGSVLDPLAAPTLRRYSTALSFYTSEFGRFRAQYNLDRTRPETDHQVMLQYTVSFGAHGAHGY